MPEQLSSQENYSYPLHKGRETPTAPAFAIYIDQSHAVYNNYHNSQNQKTIETINSNNASSTQAHNSSLHGDAKWTFRTERTPGQAYSTESARPGASRYPQRRHRCSPPSSPHLAEFPSPGFESIDTDFVGHGNSQPRNREPASDPIGRYHNATSRGLSQHAPSANGHGILAGLSIFIWWLLAWFRNPTGTSLNHGSPSDGYATLPEIIKTYLKEDRLRAMHPTH
ncbi:hypothetical protein H1R20_g8743, partial [Candolleomyces eurysporus]